MNIADIVLSYAVLAYAVPAFIGAVAVAWNLRELSR